VSLKQKKTNSLANRQGNKYTKKGIHTDIAPVDKSARETPSLKILISISATNLTYILHNARNIQERMHALIAQHGSALAALAALQQHLEAQQNDEQIDPLENPVPHIDVLVAFNQDTSESTHERRSCLQRKQRAKQCTKSAEPSETSEERSNRLCR